ncbi:phasin family protein [uncultured Sphingomonas sp.]|uniref:phasin family protein n=1 Tax=uncultured Sphingomonas sp. TaxID=158754 RepID=UPI0035CAFB71
MADIDPTEARIIDSIPAALAARPAKRGRPARVGSDPTPEPIVVPIEADIAAVALVAPAAPEPVRIPHPTAAASAEPIQKEATMATTAETITRTTETTMNKGARVFADMNDRAKGMIERAPKLVEDMADLNKGNVEALVESGRIAVRGMEAMGQHTAELARSRFEGATAAFRQLAAAKSPTELLRIQGELARTALDQLVADMSRSTETMMKFAGEVAQPISNRYAVVADRVKSAA